MVDVRGETVEENQAFHLRRDAPLDLVTEVYWHLAFGLREGAGDDVARARRLDELNHAYAMVVQAGERGMNGRRPVPALLTPPPARRRRSLFSLGREHADGDAPRVTPGELLCVEVDAPQDVIAIAYAYWAKRLRNSDLRAVPGGLNRLEESYATLASTATPSAIDHSSDDGVADGPPVLEELAAPVQPATPVESAAGVEAPSSEGREAGRSRKRSGRLAVAVRRRARRSYRRFIAVAKKRLVDPFGEFEKYAREGPPGKPTAREEAQFAQHLGQRFANLTAPAEGQDAEAASELPPAAVSHPPATEHQPTATPAVALVAISGTRDGATIPVRRSGFTIGTSPDCDLVHASDGAAEEDVTARIVERGGRYLLHVLGSRAIVAVNDAPTDWALLEPGDRLRVGDDVFVFQQT